MNIGNSVPVSGTKKQFRNVQRSPQKAAQTACFSGFFFINVQRDLLQYGRFCAKPGSITKASQSHGSKIPKLAKARDKTYTMQDSGGMYLEISTTGSKIWRMSYRQENGKRNRLTFDSYPTVSLLEARKKRDAAHKSKSDGVDPAQKRRETKLANAVTGSHTFEAVALTWLSKTEATRAASTQEK
jgi:hypothetical protein